MVSKALVVAAYQRKAEELAQLGVDLTVLVPPAWQDRRGALVAQPRYTAGYEFKIVPLRLNGSYHLHFYPTLAAELAHRRPHLLHMDEEPYNLATWLALRAAKRNGVASIFFTWQNIERRYPPPFRWFEGANYRRARVAIAGNGAAATVLRQKGYRGEVAVIPQFGVDPELFCPAVAQSDELDSGLHIGYAGGLLPEKGVDLLIRACAGLQGNWQLQIAGEGNERSNLQTLVAQLGLTERVQLLDRLESTQMPAFYRGLDLLVLPSRTLPTWKEQFGRVLIEAMACGVPVVGSDCGEIPNVIGEAGIIFPEGQVEALRHQLQLLLDDPAQRRRLGGAGRQRILTHFTMAKIAQQTVSVYERAIQKNRSHD